MKNILEQLRWRYATKKFDPDKRLSAQKIEIIKEAFDLTATSFGLQPLKLLIVSDQQIKSKLVEHSFNQQMVGDASHLLVFCIESGVDKAFIEQHFRRVEQIRKTPREILDPYQQYLIDLYTSKDPQDTDQWMTKQAYLAMGNLLTVCAMEEIDACPMEGFVPQKYDQLLELDKRGLRSVLVMPIGYRHKDDLFSELKKVRRGVDQVVIEIG